MPADHLVFATQAHGTPWSLIEAVAVAFFGSFVAIELISRFLGARSAAVARGGTVTGGVMYIVIGMLPVFLGLAASGLVQGSPELQAKLVNSEQMVSVLSEHYLPQWHYVIFGGALISAILSVVHSALHASGAQVSHNIVVRLIPTLGIRGKLIAARLSVVALTGAAFVLALDVGPHQGAGRDRLGLRQRRRVRVGGFRDVHALRRRGQRGCFHPARHGGMGAGPLRARVGGALSRRARVLGDSVRRHRLPSP